LNNELLKKGVVLFLLLFYYFYYFYYLGVQSVKWTFRFDNYQKKEKKKPDSNSLWIDL